LQQSLVRLMRTFAPSAIGLAAAGVAWSAHAAGETRALSFFNIHTKEKATITYKRDGKFDPEGLRQINHMMRDWRRDEPTEMDPELIDTIWEIYRDVGTKEPIHLVSGYRSQKTNDRLRRRGGGQARKSQHILGKAADIHFPDVDVKKLRNSALVREVGGVGYYPKSGIPFVHVDTGRVRHWPRLPRQELALLFPNGKTQHVPSDGKPLTRRDGEIALAKLDKKIDSFIEKNSKVKLPPKMMMAGFTPPGLTWSRPSPDVTGSLPEQKAPAPAAEKSEKMVSAAIPPAPLPMPKPVTVKAPAPRPVQPLSVATIDEAEHPEELSYTVYAVLPLLGEASISADRQLAQLTAPQTDEDGYLLRDPEEFRPAQFAEGLGYSRKLKAASFIESDSAPRPIRTASR
jgi:uncharacterized protein YcbK (DUF882 family)